MDLLELPSELLYNILYEYLNDHTISKIVNNGSNNKSNYISNYLIYTSPEKYSLINCICKKFRSIVNLMNINIIHKKIKEINKINDPSNIKKHIYVHDYIHISEFCTYPDYSEILAYAISLQQYDTYIIYTYNSKNIKLKINSKKTTCLYDGAKCNVFIVNIYNNKIMLNFTLNKLPYYTLKYHNIEYPDILVCCKYNFIKYRIPSGALRLKSGVKHIGCDGYISLNEYTYATNKLEYRYVGNIKFITSEFIFKNK